MKAADFDFPLPAAAIAQRPVVPRDAARLLVVGDGLRHRHVSDLPAELRPGDLLVLNDTRVLPTRLAGRRGSVAIAATLHTALDDRRWRALVRPARRLRPGDRIVFAPELTATVESKGEGGEVLLRFATAGAPLLSALERYGAMPLPPYIRRPAPDPRDRDDYQTIYAATAGAVAAPTAGLHFTHDLLAALAAAGIGRVMVTLHVGAGTFLPVRAEDVALHRMHPERGEITAAAAAGINAARAAGGRIVCVGTTSLRLLESAADADGRVQPFAGETDIFITPGYRVRAADALMTNFHLPRSTLFMLVCAFAGLARMQAAYAEAIARGYRFYSYGDACLLWPPSGAAPA
jgi:S-adenosylmethionine:tRNA ribosyltransferase-isomerase